MEWNNTATGQGIFQEIDYLAHTNSSTFSIADKTRSVNNWQDFFVDEIIDAMDDWDFNGEIATANLSANQQEYVFPTDIITIKRIEVDYDAGGVYTPVDFSDENIYPTITIGTSAEINDRFSQSDPKIFLFDNSFFLAPVPDTNVTSGIKIWYTQNVATFTAVSTGWGNSAIVGNSGNPAISRSFHKAIAWGGVKDYAFRNKDRDMIVDADKELFGTVLTRRGRIGGFITKMKKYYSQRAGDKIQNLQTRYFKKRYD